MLPERGILVVYETDRRWLSHFGRMIAAGARSPAHAEHNLTFGYRQDFGR
jgi:hypothetical protein